MAVSGTLVASCGGNESTAQQYAPPTDIAMRCPAEADPVAALDVGLLVGLDEAAATARARESGCEIRVLKRDGEDLDGNFDYRETRVNVEIRDGKISRVIDVG